VTLGVAAAVGGCTLLAPVALCASDAECPAVQVCGPQAMCVFAPGAPDAGPLLRPELPTPDDDDDDDPAAPEIMLGVDADGGWRDEGRSDAGDAGAPPSPVETDGGAGLDGRPVGATPPGTTTTPSGPTDAGTDAYGRCTADWACADDEVCEQGACVAP